MKKLIYTAALVILGITASNAQEPGKRKAPAREGREVKERVEGRRLERDKLTSEQRAERAANAMQKRLALTEEQKQKVQELELDRIKKSEEWRKQDEKTMRNKIEERKAFIASSQERIKKILTEEQREKLASERENIRERVKTHRAKRPDHLNDRTPSSPPTKN